MSGLASARSFLSSGAAVGLLQMGANATRAAQILLDASKRNYPVRKVGTSTGSVNRLRVATTLTPGGFHLALRGPQVAAFLITGTRPHDITVRKASALRWVDASGTHFAYRVHHPGTRANIFNRSRVVFAARPAIIALGMAASRTAIHDLAAKLK